MARWMAALAVVLAAAQCPAERIKDIVDIKGVRGNPLEGIGLVTGLKGTGDSSAVSQRLAANIVRRMGLSINLEDITSKNIAVVMVKAELGPFSRRDSKIDVVVSALGSATSLEGGELQVTPLMGADQQVYAVAHGAVTVGGFSATGQASSVSKNHPTIGRIPGGATVEKEELAEFVENGQVTLLVRNCDFATAENVARAINAAYPQSSFAEDAGAVRVSIPKGLAAGQVAGFISRIGELEAQVDQPAKVVINDRTGTVIVGEKVGISTIAIAHGSLSIIIEEKDFVSQPLPFSSTGGTQKINRTDIRATEEKAPMVVIGRKPSVADLARALNAMGLTPRDIISVFENLRAQGALQAELVIR